MKLTPNPSTATIRLCPVCNVAAVLTRSDEICSECQLTIIEDRDCKSLTAIHQVVWTAGLPFVVADVNAHSLSCETCTGLVASTL